MQYFTPVLHHILDTEVRLPSSTGLAPEPADCLSTASGMFSARGKTGSEEELGPWITSEDLAALNMHEVTHLSRTLGFRSWRSPIHQDMYLIRDMHADRVRCALSWTDVDDSIIYLTTFSDI